MFHVALWEPEIPPNTGNIGRTCVAIGAKLWLVEPLGFQIDEKQLRRAFQRLRNRSELLAKAWDVRKALLYRAVVTLLS